MATSMSGIGPGSARGAAGANVASSATNQPPSRVEPRTCAVRRRERGQRRAAERLRRVRIGRGVRRLVEQSGQLRGARLADLLVPLVCHESPLEKGHDPKAPR